MTLSLTRHAMLGLTAAWARVSGSNGWTFLCVGQTLLFKHHIHAQLNGRIWRCLHDAGYYAPAGSFGFARSRTHSISTALDIESVGAGSGM